MKTKSLALSTFFLLALLQLSFGQDNKQGTKHALIFAIGDYTPNSGWPHISSIRDVSYVKTAFANQGFKDIKIVEDKDATTAGIATALNELITNSKPGDIVAIHFSTHGEQVEDDSGSKPDGLEESIVAYDAKLPAKMVVSRAEFLKYRTGYFLDNRFGSYIDTLRTKLGKDGDVVIFMDLCYAGTGTRGVSHVRGGKPALVSTDFESKNYKLTDENKPQLPLVDQTNMAPYVVIGAARATEPDTETLDDNNADIGPLSYAISKVFNNLDTSVTTYHSLFAKIQAIMNQRIPYQHPVLSGNGIDRKLFGGSFVVQKPFIEIDTINGLAMGLKAGKFAGLDVGAKVAVYPEGTIDPKGKSPLAMATITKAGIYTSTAQLDKDPKLAQAALGWVFVTDQVFKAKALKVAIISAQSRGPVSTAYSQNEMLTIKTSLERLPAVKIGNNPDIQIEKKPTSDYIIISATGTLFDSVPHKNSVTDTARLRRKVQSYIQYGFLRDLNVDDPDIKLEMKLIPLKADGKPDSSKIALKDTSYAFKDGDKFTFWVKNNGDEDVYFNVIDMQPNGIVNAILPIKHPRKGSGIAPEQLRIPARKSVLFNRFKVTIHPPYGKEIFKVFASTDVIDMEDLASSEGERNGTSRGNLHPFVQLFKKTYTARGGEPESVSDSDGCSFNLYFDITPK